MVTSTTLLIGRMPASTSRRFIQSGDSPIVTPATIATNRGQRSGASTTTVAPRSSATVGPGIGRRHRRAAATEVRGELARDADDAHRVGAVGRDREVEHDVVETEHLAHVGAERGVGRQLEDAGVVVAEAELAGRAQHALRHLAADLAALDLEVAGQVRADPGERHDHARLDVGRAAHHAHRAVARVDVGEPDAVGVGVRHDLEDARDDDAADLAAGLVDRLDLEAELVQRVGDVSDRRLDGREVANPRERCAHRRASELRGETNVAVPEVLDVIDAVEQLHEPVDAEAEREAR